MKVKLPLPFVVVGLVQHLLAPDFYRKSRLFDLATRIGYLTGEKRRAVKR